MTTTSRLARYSSIRLHYVFRRLRVAVELLKIAHEEEGCFSVPCWTCIRISDLKEFLDV